MKSCELFFREASAEFADRLVSFRFAIVASQQEGAVPLRTLAFAIVAADDDQIEAVSRAGKVILLDLSWIDQIVSTIARST